MGVFGETDHECELAGTEMRRRMTHTLTQGTFMFQMDLGLAAHDDGSVSNGEDAELQCHVFGTKKKDQRACFS